MFAFTYKIHVIKKSLLKNNRSNFELSYSVQISIDYPILLLLCFTYIHVGYHLRRFRRQYFDLKVENMINAVVELMNPSHYGDFTNFYLHFRRCRQLSRVENTVLSHRDRTSFSLTNLTSLTAVAPVSSDCSVFSLEQLPAVSVAWRRIRSHVIPRGSFFFDDHQYSVCFFQKSDK